MVGTNVGRVHDQRQGTGKATILGESEGVGTYGRLAAEDRALNAAKAAKKQADMDAAYKRMTDFNPDRWFKHEGVVKNELNSWVDKGAELFATGVNPWQATSPEALDWRKKQIEIQGLAKGTEQMKDAYVALRTKIDGAEPGKYTPASLNDIADFFDKDPREVMKTGELPPNLMQTKPNLQLQDYFSKVVQPLNASRNGVPMSTEEKWKVAKESLQDPDKGDDLNDSFRSMFAQMDPADRDDLRRRAQATGVSEMQQAAFDYVDRYSVERKPFQYDQWKKDAIARVDVPYKEWQGTESFSKKADQKELGKIVDTVARDMFVADDRALQEYEKVLPRDPGETDLKYRGRATQHLAKTLRAEKATNELAGQREAGKGKEDLTVSRVKWLDDAMSTDPEKYREAAGYLFQTGDVMGNMTVADSEIIPAAGGTNMQPYPVLRVKLKGDLTLKDVKEQLGPAGETVTEVDQRGTETSFDIPVTNQTENYLLSLHDKAFDQKKKTPYAGSFRQTKPLTLSQMKAGVKPEIAPTSPKFDF